MADHGIKVSLPGYDVKTATVEQCVVHSGYASPKVKKVATPVHRGLVQINFTSTALVVGNNTIYSFAHGYNYVPSVMGSFQAHWPGTLPNDLYGTMPWIVSDTDQVLLESDATNVYVVWGSGVGGNASALTLSISYYVFAENGK